MELIERLTSEELHKIKTYIKEYAGEEAEPLYDSVRDINYILRFWSEDKANLGKMFGDQLILTKELTITQDISDIAAIIRSQVLSCESPGYTFVKAFNKWIKPYWNDNCDVYYYLVDLVSSLYLATNIYENSTVTIPNPNGRDIVVPKGCKISKILGKIAKTFDLPGYEEFRIAHSLCLNQKRIKGQVCLSIHPLDYMTMSDNACDWDSCMSWTGYGDYRQGTVEMMNSPYVVVAYLKSSSDMQLIESDPDLKWNSKRWRQLYIVHPKLIMSIKQYPYENDELNGFCLKWLRDLASQIEGFGPYDTTMSQVRNQSTNTFANNKQISYFSIFAHFMYNDIYSSHTAFAALEMPELLEFNYSGKSECMKCGMDVSGYPTDHFPTNSLLCADCGCFSHCEICGYVFTSPDDGNWVGDSHICDDCWENHVSQCEICDEYVFDEERVRIHVVDENGKYTQYEKYICDNCYMYNDKFATTYLKEDCDIMVDETSRRSYVKITDLNSDGFSFFDIPFSVEVKYLPEDQD